MKKLTVERILTILVIALMVVSLCFPVISHAAPQLNVMNTIDPNSVKAYNTNAAASTNTFLGSILGIIQVVAVVVAVIMLIVLGVKYVSAAPAEKADIKQSAMIYVVGAILMFGASLIIQVIKGFATQAIG